MADTDGAPQDDTPVFETDTVQADRAREQGLGLGERELKAQRDPGGVRTPDETDEDAIEDTVGVQGADETEQDA